MSTLDDLTLQRKCSIQAVQHKKKMSDQVSAYTQREDREQKYQKKSVGGGLVCKLQDLSQIKRNGRVEAVVGSVA